MRPSPGCSTIRYTRSLELVLFSTVLLVAGAAKGKSWLVPVAVMYPIRLRGPIGVQRRRYALYLKMCVAEEDSARSLHKDPSLHCLLG